MAGFVVTYDVSKEPRDPHPQILALASKHGWDKTVLCGQRRKQLPNTTLYGTFTDIDAAEKAFRSLIAATEMAIGRKAFVERVFLGAVAPAKAWDLGEFK